MTDAEIRLKCMEMALQMARAEGKSADRDFVADLQTWLYNRIVTSPDPKGEEAPKPEAPKPQEPGKGQPKNADKAQLFK